MAYILSTLINLNLLLTQIKFTSTPKNKIIHNHSISYSCTRSQFVI